MPLNLPDSYFMSVALCAALFTFGLFRFRDAWAFPYCAVLATIAAWYFVEPLYFSDEFARLDPYYIRMAFDGVIVFLVFFAVGTLLFSWSLTPKAAVNFMRSRAISADRVLLIVAGVWALVLLYGIYRMQGDVLGALYPLGGRTGSNMWSRAAGAGAGDDSFIVSTAAYIYTLCLAFFGVMLFIVEKPSYRALALALILLSWPFAFLQGSRNVALAVVVPGAMAYLLSSRHSMLMKVVACGAGFVVLEAALRVVIQYRDVGFANVDLMSATETGHLGLNMASELVYSVQYDDEGTLSPSYGFGYIAELANIVPRSLWPDKPLIGNDYAIARGFGGADNDIGVFATISRGVIGQGVSNFGPLFGPAFAALILASWVAVLARFRRQGTALRYGLFLVGIGLTFNLGRDISLLVLWPIVFGYLGVRLLEGRARRDFRMLKESAALRRRSVKQ